MDWNYPTKIRISKTIEVLRERAAYHGYCIRSFLICKKKFNINRFYEILISYIWYTHGYNNVQLQKWYKRGRERFVGSKLLCFSDQNEAERVSIYKHSIDGSVWEPARPDSIRPLCEIAQRENVPPSSSNGLRAVFINSNPAGQFQYIWTSKK